MREHDIIVHPPQMELEGDLMISTEKQQPATVIVLGYWTFGVSLFIETLLDCKWVARRCWWFDEESKIIEAQVFFWTKEKRQEKHERSAAATTQSSLLFSHLHDVWNKLSSGRIPRSAIKIERHLRDLWELFSFLAEPAQSDREGKWKLASKVLFMAPTSMSNCIH